MVQTFRTLLLAAAVALGTLALAVFASAGEFNEADGAAIRGYDAVAYFRENRPVKGSAEFRHLHKGSTFLFASAANRDAFAADADHYAPQYDGYCAFGASRGYKADVDPAAFSVIADRLYLNYNAKVQRDWLADPPRFIREADQRWPETRATTKVFR